LNSCTLSEEEEHRRQAPRILEDRTRGTFIKESCGHSRLKKWDVYVECIGTLDRNVKGRDNLGDKA
jgi:hypothetical protein